jgi:hypothetical protein
VTATFEWEGFTEQRQYLANRGIDDITLQRMKVEVVTAHKLTELGFKFHETANRAILWNIRDISGKPTQKYGARVFYNKGFAPENKRPKFLTPKGQIPGVYFSPLARWDKMEYGQNVYICESFLKADIACMLGFHSVGVSGCWGWLYKNQLNWDFQKIPWRDMGLVPVICFDSNVHPETPLYGSATKFRAQMDMLVHIDSTSIIELPPQEADPRKDWGLDDFYQEKGRQATLDFLNSEPTRLPSELRQYLKEMNDRVVFVKELSRVADIESGILMSRGNFEDMNYANIMAENAEGKVVPVAKVWTRWDKRREVKKIGYYPGEERVVDPEYYNLWRGMGCEPKMGDVSLFTDWINAVFQSEMERDFFLDWWSWQLQNLGGKLTPALVMVGKSGIGKGWMTDLVRQIFGQDNVAPIDLFTLGRQFNGDYATKQLAIVEESDQLASRGGGAIYNKLKDMITNEFVRVERKGMDAFTVENRVNLFLQGNNIDIFKIDEFDRRLAVLELVDRHGVIRNKSDYWIPRWRWGREGGAAIVYGFLLSRDLSNFDPQGEAPMTEAKRDMVEMTHAPIDQWVSDLMSDPVGVMQVKGSVVDGRIHTAKELMWVYMDGNVPLSEITRADTMKMVKALKNARIPVANGGAKIKVGNQSQRYFLINGGVEGDKSFNWSKEGEERVFWKALVASGQGQVASESGVGNRNTKF